MTKITLKQTSTTEVEIEPVDLAQSIYEDWEPQEIANFLVDLLSQIKYDYSEQLFVESAHNWGFKETFEKWAKGEAS
jgi:hypothetical protein